MTGLDLFFHHVETLSQIQAIDVTDIGRVQKMIEAVEYDPENITGYAISLTSFYNDIVAGLNAREFIASEATITKFSLYHGSRLPKFLLGLTSRVFGYNGVLLESYDRTAVENLLTLLSLTKRIDSKETIRSANEAGVKSYRASQAGRKSMSKELKDLYKLFWSTLLAEWDSCITWGDLGPGALLDKEFPHERHLALPALYGAPPEIQSFLTKALRQRFRRGIRLQRFFHEDERVDFDQLIQWLHSPECLQHPFVFAYRSSDQPSKLSVVEKSCLISRPITVTYGFKAILGACVRATGRKVTREIWGIDSTLNVDDQTLSHQFLYKYFNDAFCADFKDGSGNFLHEDVEGSLPSNISVLEAASTTRNCTIVNGPNLEPDVVEAVTLQMGDSSCNFFLTASTFFLYIAGIIEQRFESKQPYSYQGGVQRVHPFIGHEFDREWMRKLILEASKLCHCVGDDLIGRGRYYNGFVAVVNANNIRLNTRKSSAPDAIHKETCGAWILNHGDSYTEIFPFRAPKIVPGYKYQTLLNCTQYLHKISGSELMCRLMTITLAKTVRAGHELLSVSRSLDEIGNPYGQSIPLQAIPVIDSQPAPITDALRAFFFVPQDLYPVLGAEGSRKKHQRFRLSRCQARYAPSCKLENRQRLTDVRDWSVVTHALAMHVTEKYGHLRAPVLKRISDRIDAEFLANCILVGGTRKFIS